VFALIQMWMSRGVLDPDGISYSDLAKALLRGDWRNGLSTYWSPLYSWLLALAYEIFRPGMERLIFVAHVLNFVAFLAVLLAWEWLLREWERWKGPPRHRAVVETVGYAVVAWVGLHVVGLGFTSADMIVAALTIVLAILLLRVRAGVARQADFIVLGCTLGCAFLAKAATLALYPAVLGALAWLTWKRRDRRWQAAAALACLIPLPFILLLSAAKGRFVVNDTGRINYSWQVTGMSVEGYKENQFWPGQAARHPLTVLMDTPRVISYASHPVGTSPVHFDPAWWCEGYPVRLNVRRQLMVLWSNIAYCATRFGLCPALWFALGCCLLGSARGMLRRLGELWFIWMPALVAVASYCVIYALNRYMGGAFALLGFCLIAACWNAGLSPRVAAAAPAAMLLLFCGMVHGELLVMPFFFLKGLLGSEDPLIESDVRAAITLRQYGFRAGDKVGLIGNTLMVAWLHLLDGQLIASVPMTIGHDDRAFGRPLSVTFEKMDFFWRSDPPTQQRVLDAFRAAGARWALASNVPKWANLAGWGVAGHSPPYRDESLSYMYYKRLY
jgi:hypothetical protein